MRNNNIGRILDAKLVLYLSGTLGYRSTIRNLEMQNIIMSEFIFLGNTVFCKACYCPTGIDLF
jgi:hypothetical protein